MPQIVNVTLIGLNRATASLGMALREYSQQAKSAFDFQITGQDGEKKHLEAALHFEAIHKMETNAKSAVRYADVVIVSLPAAVLEGVYEYFSSALKPGTVVLDMSIGKAAVVRFAEQYFPRQPDGSPQAFLVGIQPLVSNAFLYDSQTGIESATPKLFQGSEMIVAPHVNCPPEAVKLATDLAPILGMQAHFMDLGDYEALAVITEQLPILLGLGVFGGIVSGAKDLERMVNPSLARLMEGLQGAELSDILAMWSDHRLASQRHLDQMIAVLEHLRHLLAQDVDADLKKHLQESLSTFYRWEGRREAGRWDAPEKAPEIPSLFSTWFGFGGRKSPPPQD